MRAGHMTGKWAPEVNWLLEVTAGEREREGGADHFAGVLVADSNVLVLDGDVLLDKLALGLGGLLVCGRFGVWLRRVVRDCVVHEGCANGLLGLGTGPERRGHVGAGAVGRDSGACQHHIQYSLALDDLPRVQKKACPAVGVGAFHQQLAKHKTTTLRV